MDIQPVETETITATLSANTGFGGSFSLPYPAGRGATDYAGSRAVLRSNSRDNIYQSRDQFDVVYGASSITITVSSAASYPEGETVYLDIDTGARGRGSEKIPAPLLAQPNKMDQIMTVSVDLGVPDAADADAVVESQAATAAGGLATGFVGGGPVILDVPRNIVASWTGAAVLTVTGLDEHGNVVVESSASGTSMTGAKAFASVTGVSVSSDVTGLTVGTGAVLGLPCYLPSVGDVLTRKTDGATVTNGTLVAGVLGAQTATTGDVSGTYAPSAAPNGTRSYDLLIAVRDPSYTGADQFSG